MCAHVSMYVPVISVVCDHLLWLGSGKAVTPPLFFVSEQGGKSCAPDKGIMVIGPENCSHHLISDLQFLMTNLKVVFVL